MLISRCCIILNVYTSTITLYDKDIGTVPENYLAVDAVVRRLVSTEVIHFISDNVDILTCCCRLLFSLLKKAGKHIFSYIVART